MPRSVELSNQSEPSSSPPDAVFVDFILRTKCRCLHIEEWGTHAVTAPSVAGGSTVGLTFTLHCRMPLVACTVQVFLENLLNSIETSRSALTREDSATTQQIDALLESIPLAVTPQCTASPQHITGSFSFRLSVSSQIGLGLLDRLATHLQVLCSHPSLLAVDKAGQGSAARDSAPVFAYTIASTTFGCSSFSVVSGPNASDDCTFPSYPPLRATHFAACQSVCSMLNTNETPSGSFYDAARRHSNAFLSLYFIGADHHHDDGKLLNSVTTTLEELFGSGDLTKRRLLPTSVQLPQELFSSNANSSHQTVSSGVCSIARRWVSHASSFSSPDLLHHQLVLPLHIDTARVSSVMQNITFVVDLGFLSHTANNAVSDHRLSVDLRDAVRRLIVCRPDFFAHTVPQQTSGGGSSASSSYEAEPATDAALQVYIPSVAQSIAKILMRGSVAVQLKTKRLLVSCVADCIHRLGLSDPEPHGNATQRQQDCVDLKQCTAAAPLMFTLVEHGIVGRGAFFGTDSRLSSLPSWVEMELRVVAAWLAAADLENSTTVEEAFDNIFGGRYANVDGLAWQIEQLVVSNLLVS